MDEKTPHMHLCFVPLTEDGRLSAKDIVSNRKKLTWWQDEFRKHKEILEAYQSQKHAASLHEPGKNGQQYE